MQGSRRVIGILRMGLKITVKVGYRKKVMFQIGRINVLGDDQPTERK